MSIKICDSIMGSGKSQSTIHMINDNPDKKYIYVAPYLAEAERIQKACPNHKFVQPGSSNKYRNQKFRHTKELIKNGKNIASTHTLLSRYTTEMIEDIRKNKYTLVIDEAFEVMQPSSMLIEDYEYMKRFGFLNDEDKDNVVLKPDIYQTDEANERGMFAGIIKRVKSNTLIETKRDEKKVYYLYWVFRKEILEAFEDVYVLTYLFEGQPFKYYLDKNKLDYTYIHIDHPSENDFHFVDELIYLPKYVGRLSNMIHIFENEKINSIGDNKHALSSSWIQEAARKQDKSKLMLLSNNVYNYFRNYVGNIPSKERMWATYKVGMKYLRRNGYYNRDVVYNMRATNELANKRALAYCVNVFMNPTERNYFVKHGVTVDEDTYALSVMIQWIWRSAIRNGEEIWIYIPSRRMRSILKRWISETEQKYKELYGEEGCECI